MPMTQAVWIALGATGLLATFASMHARFRGQPEVQLASIALAAAIWPVFSINAFSVAVVTDTGTTIVTENPALGYLGGLFALLVILDLFFAVMGMASMEAHPRLRI